MEIDFALRAQLMKNKSAQTLSLLMARKKSNLCVAADLTHKKNILELANKIGPHICLLKTHVDIIDDFDESFLKELTHLAKKHEFMIFEDRKFADIGNTSMLQYKGGIFRIAEWADFVNAHLLPGPGIIEGLQEVGEKLGRGLILLAQMSSAGSLLNKSYTQKVVKAAELYSDFAMGFIAMGRITKNPAFLHLTPGVKLEAGKDRLGQNWQTVEKVLLKDKTDVIIVGRDICNAEDPQRTAKKYQDIAWACYEKRLRK